MAGEDRSEPAGSGPDPSVPPGDDAGSDRGATDAATYGTDDVLGREVALVTLPAATGREHVDRVDRIRRLARLHHPHLLEVYDVDGLGDDAEHVLVLESVEGRRLDRLLADGPLGLERVAEIGARVASALAHAHQHGVVHGRLGPASVLVADDHHVWLVGLTASLHPDVARTHPVETHPGGSAPTPSDDLRALSSTLARAVDPADADELAAVVGEAREGRGTADELSGRLVRRARRDATPTDTTGITPVPAPRPVPLRRMTARALVGAGAVAGTAAGASTRPPDDATPTGSGSRAARPAGLLGRSARLVTLAAVALLLALTSGLLIWGQETGNWFGAAQAEPRERSDVGAPGRRRAADPLLDPRQRVGCPGAPGRGGLGARLEPRTVLDAVLRSVAAGAGDTGTGRRADRGPARRGATRHGATRHGAAHHGATHHGATHHGTDHRVLHTADRVVHHVRGRRRRSRRIVVEHAVLDDRGLRHAGRRVRDHELGGLLPRLSGEAPGCASAPGGGHAGERPRAVAGPRRGWEAWGR